MKSLRTFGTPSPAEFDTPIVSRSLVDASLNELDRRLSTSLRAFLDERFVTLQMVDAPEDAIATSKARSCS